MEKSRRGYNVWREYVCDPDETPLDLLNRLLAELIDTVDDARQAGVEQ